MKTDRAVVVMAKYPRMGRVKTRLAKDQQTAVTLYRAFFADVIGLVDRARERIEFDRVLALACDRPAELEEMLPPGWHGIVQRGDELGARMENALLDSKRGSVVILGSDSPTLPSERIDDAFGALAFATARIAVVGPANDGGYYAIATRKDTPELFRELPWSTPHLMDATRARARKAGITLVELEPFYDLDEPEDLARAAQDIERFAPHTHRALTQLRRGD